jgi:hypothetical protein
VTERELLAGRRRGQLASRDSILAGADDVLDGDGGLAGGGGVVERLEREVVGGAQVAAADLEQRVERALVERDAGGAGDGAAVGDVLCELLAGQQAKLRVVGMRRAMASWSSRASSERKARSASANLY